MDSDFIARLAALVPRPRAHLVRYHGLFAPNAHHPRLIVTRHHAHSRAEHGENTSDTPTAPLTSMARLNRVFAIDISTWPTGGAQLRVIGAITEPTLFTPILQHLKQREPQARHPRAPPLSPPPLPPPHAPAFKPQPSA